MRGIWQRTLSRGFRRSISIVACTWVILATGCSGTPYGTLDDEYAVYSVVIGDILRNPTQSLGLSELPARVVIQEETATRSVKWDRKFLGWIDNVFESEIPRVLIRDFKRKNKNTDRLEQQFTLPVDYLLISGQVIEELLFSDPAVDGWENFYRHYPDSPGFIVLSRVGFDSALSMAVVYVSQRRQSLAGGGSYYLLSREDSTWKIANVEGIWIS